MKKPASPAPTPPGGDLILYQTEDGRTRLEVRFQGETVWLSLNQLADLFQRDKSVISKHIRNVFAEGELRPEATVAKFATVQSEGGRTVEPMMLAAVKNPGRPTISAISILETTAGYMK